MHLCNQTEKNVWDNCAKVIISKTDEELQPYLDRLFNWIQDLNWPGALMILERLQTYRKDGIFMMCLKTQKLYAQAIDDQVWLDNIDAIFND